MLANWQRYCLALFSIALLAGCDNAPVPDAALQSSSVHSDVALPVALGQPAPDFTAVDANGNPVQLSAFRGQQAVMLLFYRGGWCPFCVSHLDDIQALFPSLAQYNVQLLAISPDDAEASAKLAGKFEQPYVFVSDAGLAITDLYGIRRDEALPHPAVFLVDRQGNIAWYYVGEDYKQRPSSAQLEQVIKTQL